MTIDGKKTWGGTAIAFLGLAGAYFGAQEEVNQLIEIVKDTEALYGMALGFVIAAFGLAHKIIKAAGPLVEMFNAWTLRQASKR